MTHLKQLRPPPSHVCCPHAQRTVGSSPSEEEILSHGEQTEMILESFRLQSFKRNYLSLVLTRIENSPVLGAAACDSCDFLHDSGWKQMCRDPWWSGKSLPLSLPNVEASAAAPPRLRPCVLRDMQEVF